MKKTQFATLLIILIFMQACVSSFEKESIENINMNVNKNDSPYEFVLEKETNKAKYYSSIKLRGQKKESIALNSKEVKDDIFKLIKDKCRFENSDLIETRLVSYKLPTVKEIWVFKDKKSQMKDQTTALFITMTANSHNSGTTLSISGHCPAKIDQFIFFK